MRPRSPKRCATQPGIVEVRPFSKDESAKLLEPWLGSGLSIEQLPVPRVIVARCSPAPRLTLAALRARVTQAAPSASRRRPSRLDRAHALDDRGDRAAGIGILALVIIATIISVSFATRGAMAANRPIVEVLHFVGAGDSYIANRFLRHFLMLGLEGGLIGGGVADARLRLLRIDRELVLGTPVGDQFAGPASGRFRCARRVIWCSQARRVLIAAITAWASRRTLFATLDDID